jgi:hypothetical protein
MHLRAHFFPSDSFPLSLAKRQAGLVVRSIGGAMFVGGFIKYPIVEVRTVYTSINLAHNDLIVIELCSYFALANANGASSLLWTLRWVHREQ